MANFKGGFAFNNEAAKVEVESWTDVSTVFGALPITLTIYHHPMP